MRKRLFFYLILIVISGFLSTGCDSGSNEYFFEQPSSFSALKGSKCLNGSVSYMGFVLDNTKNHGARLMKISGCASKIDKDFKDDFDDKTGIYISGFGIASDQIVVDGEVIIAVASSGYTEYEHWKKKKDDLRLDRHKGRIVFRKMGKDLKHDGSFNKSILLDFYPSVIKAHKTNGFYFAGAKFGKNYIGFAGTDGKGEYKEVDFVPSVIALSENGALVFDSEKGSVYAVDQSLEAVEVIANADKLTKSGMNQLSGGRLAFFKGTEILIYNSGMQFIESVNVFAGSDISAVSSVSYDDFHEYRSFTQESVTDFIKIYEREEEKDDADVMAEELADDSEETPDDDAEISEDETDEDNVALLDASEGDVIWIASKSGNLMAYDLKKKSWLVRKYSESEKISNPAYYNEMRPYINSTYVTFPKDGDTNPLNAPHISTVYSIRGLPGSITYRFSYEGSFAGTESKNGILNDGMTALTDSTVDFSKLTIDPQTDFVMLTNRINSADCMIPVNANAVITINSVISPNELDVTVEKYGDQIKKCYGTSISYAVFPNGKYSVSRETSSGIEFAGKGIELEAAYSGNDFSFTDEYAGISIKRKNDDVATSKETSFFIKISPGVPFEGFSSGDIMTHISNPAGNKMVMFSPLTRRVVEYDIMDGMVSKIYK